MARRAAAAAEPAPQGPSTAVAVARAMAHPVRLKLLDALAEQGPMTATQAATLIEETPTTCSFHFRQLARFGLVVEAEGGDGRARPWKLGEHAMHLDMEDTGPEGSAAATTMAKLLAERLSAKIDRWTRTLSDYPEPWQTSTIFEVTTTELTLAQVKQLDLLHRDFLAKAVASPTRGQKLPVQVSLVAFPISPQVSPRRIRG